MNMAPILAIAAKWRQEAAALRHRGIDDTARCVESCAEDLERGVREWELEALTLEEAAEESGYSYSALQKKVASGEIENVGNKGSPRIRRADLPRKSRGQEGRDIADTILKKRTA
jgi:hypothetical protein